jgi:hypothetical protein
VRSLLFLGMLLLGGCGSAIPIGGETAEGERFLGSLTTRGRDYGPMSMRNESGVECSGTWLFDAQNSGSASFTCSDGRSGTVELSAADATGTVRGMLDGKPFLGTFERPPP